MAVPLPDASTVNLVPPDAAEIEQMARAFATAAAAPDGITEFQRAVINATVESDEWLRHLDVGEAASTTLTGPWSSQRCMRRRDRGVSRADGAGDAAARAAARPPAARGH